MLPFKRMFAAVAPLILSFFSQKKGSPASLDVPGTSNVFALGSHSHYGSGSMDFHEIASARRKIHRAKMYKRFRGQGGKQRVKTYA
jgi:hypothetical protein